MAYFDVFNGDADGLCALHQYRMTYLADSNLVTGVKRDTKLLARVPAQASDIVNVFDVSLTQNREHLLYLLNLGARVTWFDHHSVDPIAKHAGLTAVIDIAPDVCTSYVVDRYLGSEHRAWAVVGAFGDNLDELARRLAQSLRLADGKLAQLKELGQCLNYNAYGESEADLYFHPAQLYRTLKRYSDPFRFIAKEQIVSRLREGRQQDLQLALDVRPRVQGETGDIYVLPDAAWSRRIQGEFANHLANAQPQRSHAVLAPSRQDTYVVSVRAPLQRPTGADEFCSQFETGGGRAAAAGINALAEHAFDEFSHRFQVAFSR
jgi:hypothetical protein